MEELIARIEALEKLMASKKKEPETQCKCEICGKLLKNKYTLKTHLKLHEDKSIVKVECPVCHKFYCSKYYLNKHINEKHPDTENEENHEDDHEEDSIKSEE